MYTVLPQYNAKIGTLPFLALWRGGIMVREVNKACGYRPMPAD